MTYYGMCQLRIGNYYPQTVVVLCYKLLLKRQACIFEGVNHTCLLLYHRHVWFKLPYAYLEVKYGHLVWCLSRFGGLGSQGHDKGGDFGILVAESQ